MHHTLVFSALFHPIVYLIDPKISVPKTVFSEATPNIREACQSHRTLDKGIPAPPLKFLYCQR